jgi:DNA recombination protein RmuC
MEILIAVVIGAALGGAVIWFVRRPEGDADRRAELEAARAQLAAATATAERERAKADGESQRAAAAAALSQAARDELAKAEARHAEALQAADRRRADDLQALKDTFAKQSQDALRQMSPDVTKEVASKVEPLIARVGAALESYQRSLEQGMSGQTQSLAQVQEQMRRINETASALATSTNDFTAVLKSASHRGRWGEQTLRRVVEASGLSPHCDFTEQASQDDTRPDLIVNLPGERCVIIDSKVPEFDVAIADAAAPNRKELVRAHATKLKATLRDLAAKGYPEAQRKSGRTTFDHVILFLPAESLLSTALEGDPELIVDAGREGILLATPATLMGFLAAINLTWQQHRQAENAKEIADAAAELYGRVATFVEYLTKVGKALGSASDAYNKAVGSYQSRVRVSGERLRKLGGGGSEGLAEIEAVDEDIRQLPEKGD